MRAPRDLKPRPLSVSLARFSSAVVIAAAMLGAARGASFVWDTDGLPGNNAASGAGLGGSGAWNVATPNWWNGGLANSIWNNAALDTAIFTGLAGTVNLAAPITAGNLVFNSTDYVLTGSPLTLGANAIVNLHDRNGGAVNTTISSQLAGSGLTLNALGGTLTLDYAGTHAPTGTLNIRSGTLQVNGATSVLDAATGVTFRGSGAFVLNNVGAGVPTNYNLGALTNVGGDGVVRIERTESQNVQLTFSSLTPRSAGATGLFQANGTFGVGDLASLSSNAKVSVTGLGAGFMPGYFVKSENTFAGLAFYDAGGFVRPISYGGDPQATSIVGGAQTFILNAHMQLTGSLTTQPAQQIQSLSINGNGPLTLTGLLTITNAGSGPGTILKVGDSGATISGTGVTAGGGQELIIRPDSATDILTISAPITNTTGALTKSGNGTLILSSGSNAFTGTTYVNGGKLTIRGAGAAGAGTDVVLGGGTYELLGYGANNNTVETIATGKNITVTGSGTLGAGRLTPGSDPATNKTLSFGTLSIGNQVLTADPAVYAAGANPPFAGVYSLSVTGITTFRDVLPATLNVTGTQASGTTPALTLSGVVQNDVGINVGFIKRGTGTLALGNAGNTFGGAGAVVELQEGVLSIASDGALGHAANSLLLNAGDPTDWLLTTATFSSARAVALGQVTNAIEVASGTTLTLDGLVTSNIPADLIKRGAGTLTLTNTGNTFGGAGGVIDLQGGVLQTSTSGALGNAANTVKLSAGSFAALDTFVAPQSFLLGQAANTINVVDLGETLTISGQISSTGTVASLAKTGLGNLTLTNAGNSFGGVGSTLDIQGGGTLEVTSGGALGDPANTVKLSGGFVGNGTSTASQKFTLAQGDGATATLNVPGANTFTLAGVVANDGTTTVSLNKVGTGTLELTNVNTFGGVGRTITVSAGTLAAQTNEALGSTAGSANNINLNGGGFRAIGTFATPRVFTLSGASSSFDVTQGNTLTLSSAFNLPVATNALVKGDLGTLALTVAQPAWTGQITINAGAIRAAANAANLFGATAPATANTVINGIGGIELTANVNVAEPLTINTPGDNTTMVGSNFGGVLRTVTSGSGSAATYSGAMTVNGAVNDNTFRSIVFGADAGTTFALSTASTINFDNVAAGTGRVMNLILTGASNNANVLNSGITRTAGTTLNLVKTGIGNWTLAPTVAPQIDGIVVRSGVLQNNANATGVLPATTALNFIGSSTFRHDNVTAFAPLARTLGALTFTAGDGVVLNNRASAQNSFLTFGSLGARQTGATALFWVNGNTATFNANAKVAFTAGATANTFLGSGYFAQANSAAAGFAWYDTTGFVRTISYAGAIDPNAVTIAGGNLTAGRYMQTTGAGAVGVAGSTNVLSLHMAGTNVLTVDAAEVLTITSGSSGGLLKTGGAGSIAGGGTLSAGVGNELIIRTDTAGDSLAISIPITATGALTKSGGGTLTLSGPQSWTGGTFVNGGMLVIQGANALAGGPVLGLSGGRFSFQADGDGRSTRESIVTGKDVTIDGANSEILVGKQTAGQSLNKTITFGNLSIASQVLLITPSDGYGVRFTGTTNFTEALPPTFSVAGVQEFNEIPGLTLAGVVSSASGVGLVKTGTGALVLENAGNTFGSTGGLIDIQGGVLAAGSDGALGNSGNNILLNVSSGTQGFRATGSFATNRIFTLNQPANAIDVTQGNLLTLNQGLNLGGATAATNALAKNGRGVLELGGNSPATWTGAITINAGAIRLKTAAGFGGTGRIGPVVTIANPEAALQLSGTDGVYNAYPIALSNSGINTGGALENVSGNNLWTGAITLNADNTVIGASGGTLRISGGIASSTTTVRSLFLAGAGNISLLTTPLAATVGALTKIGSGTATLAVASTAYVGNLVVNAGTFAVSGEGRLGGTGTIRVNPGGTLTIIDTGPPIANRLSSRTTTFTGGSLNLIGSGNGNTLETLNSGEALFGRGLSTITVTAGAGRQAVLNFNGRINNVGSAQNTAVDTSVTPDVGPPTAASVLFRGTNLGNALGANVAQINSTSGGFTFNGQTGATGTTNKSILPWALVDTDTVTGVGTSFATADTAAAATTSTARIRALLPSEQTTLLTANTNVSLVTPQTLAATLNLNSITLRAGGRVDSSGLFQVTLSSGGILALPGNLGILGGVLNAPAGNSPLNIWTPGAATSLTISSTLGGGQGAANPGLIKAGAGLLILNAPQSLAIPGLSANSFNALTAINQGTIRLSSGNNTLFPNNFVEVGPGGTLDLAGNSQWVQALFTDGTVAGAGGVVTSSTGTGTLVANYDNTARTWAGSIQGPVAFSRSGQNTATFLSDQTYTEATQITGGTTILRDAAALSGTSSVAVNFATLNLDNGVANGGTLDAANRLNDAATLSLSGAGFVLTGRPQTETAETLGDLTIAQGLSTITANASGGATPLGLYSAALTFGDGVGASLDRQAGGVVNFAGQTNGAAVSLGLIGNGPRILFTNAPTLSHGIIGPWAVVIGLSSVPEYASYVSTLGVGALGTAGFAPYDGTVLPGADAPTQNFRVIAAPTVSAARTINSLNLVGVGMNFTGDSLLTLASGGLMHSGASGTIGGAGVGLRGQLTAGTTNAPSDLVIYNQTNTLTINSKIVNNAASGPVTLVLAGGGTITLAPQTANTHSGGTIVNNGLTVNTSGAAAATVVFPVGGLILNGGTVTANLAGQIAPANVVTLNGPAALNLTGDNTLNTIVFNNTGGTGNPVINSGGILTLGGTVSATSRNVTTTSVLAGRVALPVGSTSFAVDPILFNGDEVAPTLTSLILQGIGNGAGGISTGGITKTGNGVLQFNAQALFSGQVDVQGGGIQFATAGNGSASGSRFANLNLGAGTRVNLNTGGGLFGSLSGSGVVTNTTTAGQTLTVGFNGSSTTFSGRFARQGSGNPNVVNITKIGVGTMTLTGADSDSTGTLSIQGGSVTYSGVANTSFGANTVLTGGTLTLNNAGTNKNNRLGGVGGAGANAITLTISGGTVNLIGNSGADTTERINTFTVGSGAGVLDLQPNLNRKMPIEVLTTFTGLQAGGTLFIRNLPTVPDAEYVPTDGEASILLPVAINSLNAPAGFGSGFPPTELAIRPDIVAAVDGGPATSFVTKDLFTNLLRTLASLTSVTLQGPEVSDILLSGAQTPTNYDISTVATIRENTSGYSLVLQDTSGIVGQVPAPLGQYGPNATLLTQTIVSGGILAIAGGTSTITAGLLNTGTNVPLTFHAYGDLDVTANLGAGTGGITKAGAGTLTVTGRGFYTGVTTVNTGTLILNGGQENSIAVVPGATTGLTSALTVNGGVIDLNGYSQAFGTLSNNNINTGTGGVVTNTSMTPVTLTSSTATSSNFSGQITGDLDFVKTGAGTLTLTGASTYTGITTIRGGGISLRDLGALSGTSSVDISHGALTIDHTQLNPSGNLSPVRLPNVPISMFGGTLQLFAGGSAAYSATIANTVTILGGASTINTQIPSGSGSSATLTLGGLDRPSNTATLNFNSTNATLGSTGFNSRTIFTVAPTLTNNLIGPWATVAGGDFASYGANGVVGLGTYNTTTLTTGGAPTNNVSITGNPGSPIGNTILNVFRTNTNAVTVTFASAASTLTFGDDDSGNPTSGGMLFNSATTMGAGAAASNGAITSGGNELFAYVNSGSTINSVIKDGLNGPVTLVKSGGSALTVTANNTYTGGTVVNQGTLTLNNTTATGAAGAVAVPGDLLINNATVTLSLANQLRTNASVTIDGSGVLNMASSAPLSNTIGRVTFINRGGNGAPTVATSTNLNLATGGLGTPTITSTNDVMSTTPVISGNSLTLSHATPVISTTLSSSGYATTSLLITAPIHSAGGVIDKRGAGSVALNPNVGLAATTTPSSNILSDLATSAGLAVGMSVSGTNITAGSVITAILAGGTDVQLSLPTGTGASATNTITFAGSTYANGFTVNEGSLILGSSSVLDPALPLTPTVINGPVGKGTLTLANGASIMSDTVLRTLHNPVTVQGNFTFGPPAGSIATALPGNGVILAGPMTLSAGAHSIEVNGPLNISTISGLISGGGGTLTKTGNGTLVLARDGNNWGGALAVNGGVLRNGTEGAVPAGIDLSVATGAVFDTPGVNQVVRTLTGGGAVTNSFATAPGLAATLFVGGINTTDTTTVADSTFAGSIAGIVGDNNAAPPASLGLTKVGAGTLTLTGANTYRGDTTVNSGTLRVAISGSLNIASTFIVNGGATAQIDGQVSAEGSGSVQTSGIGSRLRGAGTISSNTTIGPGGILEPMVSGVNTMSFTGSAFLTLADTATLLYTASLANTNRVSITGAFADVQLPTGSGWTLKLQNANILAPAGMTFVLFDGDDFGTLLNGNTGLVELVGNPTIDFGTTGWSINMALPANDRGIHFDIGTNNIVLRGVVPEPGSGTMLLGSLAVALGLQRFRRRRA